MPKKTGAAVQKKTVVSAQRSGNYMKNLSNVRMTSDSIYKARKSAKEVQRILLERLDETSARFTELRRDKYDVYSKELSSAQKDMKEAMQSEDNQGVVAAAIRIIAYINNQVKDEKANVSSMRTLITKGKKIMADCENFENQCLVLIKKANSVALSLNPKKTPFFLSSATFDSSTFIPTDQIEMIQLDMSILHENAETFEKDGDPQEGLENEDDDDGGQISFEGKFKSSFDNAKIKRLPEIKRALLKDGMNALTPLRREVSISLYDKCLRMVKYYQDTCIDWIKMLNDKRPEIVNFFDDIDRQFNTVMQPLEYKHRIVTT